MVTSQNSLKKWFWWKLPCVEISLKSIKTKKSKEGSKKMPVKHTTSPPIKTAFRSYLKPMNATDIHAWCSRLPTKSGEIFIWNEFLLGRERLLWLFLVNLWLAISDPENEAAGCKGRWLRTAVKNCVDWLGALQNFHHLHYPIMNKDDIITEELWKWLFIYNWEPTGNEEMPLDYSTASKSNSSSASAIGQGFISFPVKKWLMIFPPSSSPFAKQKQRFVSIFSENECNQWRNYQNGNCFHKLMNFYSLLLFVVCRN